MHIYWHLLTSWGLEGEIFTLLIKGEKAKNQSYFKPYVSVVCHHCLWCKILAVAALSNSYRFWRLLPSCTGVVVVVPLFARSGQGEAWEKCEPWEVPSDDGKISDDSAKRGDCDTVPCCSWSLAKASSKHPKTDQSCTFLQLGLERIKTHQTENKSFKFDVFDHFKGSEEDYVSRIWLAILIHGEIEERCLGCFSPQYNCWRLGITAWKYWPFLCPVVTDHSFSNMYIE